MSTTQTSPWAPSREGGWSEVAFTLTAVALGVAGFIGATHVTILGLGVCQESSGGDNRCPGG